MDNGRAFSSLTGSRPVVVVGFLVEKGFLKGGMLRITAFCIFVLWELVPKRTRILMLFDRYYTEVGIACL